MKQSHSYIRGEGRYEIMEIKHGRAAMLGFHHVIAIEAGIRMPGYLSVSQDLKFSDVPAGCFASLEAVPTAGWLQIMVLRYSMLELHGTPVYIHKTTGRVCIIFVSCYSTMFFA